ncbi:hypothetical protein BRCON_1841 [Candidatus Sumerlaea chitinivorans]|uniref:Ferrous iron transporter FeoA-like domain-containing protein n=1 Tax=Sumerlaea chitinivorans TaxID=2250252 RepID=A0A2Z4Y716_SUMC1|nr:hypothetical protein BRCON_1841 [Candidatus Sumerlaea chitinivorans]
MVKCPNCGMEMPRDPNFVLRLKQWVGLIKEPLRPAPDGLCASESGQPHLTLGDVEPGGEAIIERFLDPNHVRKFLSLGVLPGTTVKVLKQFPAVLVRVGYSEFAFDRDLAHTVQVRKL